MIHEDDEAGQVLALGAEAVVDPRPHARVAGLNRAALHLEQGRAVIVARAVHRADHAQVVGVGGEAREEVGDVDAALTVLADAERALHCRAVAASHERVFAAIDGDLSAVETIERRLRIEQIDVARAAVHVEEDDALRLRREVRLSGRLGSRFARQQIGEGHHAEAAARSRQKFTSRQSHSILFVHGGFTESSSLPCSAQPRSQFPSHLSHSSKMFEERRCRFFE